MSDQKLIVCHIRIGMTSMTVKVLISNTDTISDLIQNLSKQTELPIMYCQAQKGSDYFDVKNTDLIENLDFDRLCLCSYECYAWN